MLKGHQLATLDFFKLNEQAVSDRASGRVTVKSQLNVAAETRTGLVHEIAAVAAIRRFCSANLQTRKISFGLGGQFVGRSGEVIGTL